MSRALLQEHRQVFASKTVLRDIYARWFDLLILDLPQRSRVLETGAGPGLFAEHVRARRPDLRWTAIDIVQTPWNDAVADVHRMPFRSASFDAVVGIDFVHHLANPLDFVREVARVLKPGCELRVVEPWVSLFSYPIYRFLHQEGCRLDLDPTQPFSRGEAKDPFDGDAGVTRALVQKVTPGMWTALDVESPRKREINAFAYLASLGFKRGSLLPRPLLSPLLFLDEWVPKKPFALRVELRWTRKAS